MPRITVDLLDLNGAAQVQQNSAALGPSVEEEVFGWLVLLTRQFTVTQLFETAGILVFAAGNDGELRVPRCVVSERRRNIFEPKARGGFVVSISLRSNF